MVNRFYLHKIFTIGSNVAQNILDAHKGFLTQSVKHQKKNVETGKRKVQGVPQSQTAALPRHQEEEETEKTKQAQIEQTYEKN